MDGTPQFDSTNPLTLPGPPKAQQYPAPGPGTAGAILAALQGIGQGLAQRAVDQYDKAQRAYMGAQTRLTTLQEKMDKLVSEGKKQGDIEYDSTKAELDQAGKNFTEHHDMLVNMAMGGVKGGKKKGGDGKDDGTQDPSKQDPHLSALGKLFHSAMQKWQAHDMKNNMGTPPFVAPGTSAVPAGGGGAPSASPIAPAPNSIAEVFGG